MKKNQYKYGHKDVLYTYSVLQKDISDLKKQYDFLSVATIGKSIENRKIYILKFGQGPRKVFICGGTHACEWITVPVLMKWIQEICQLYAAKGYAYGKSIEALFRQSTIHILPMVNPDGIELQIRGVSDHNPNGPDLTKWNNGSQDFSKWKANSRGVDLNRNFDAKWEACRKIGESLGITGPWLELYGGEYPESEPETLAVVNYTLQENFDIVLSYHTQGREIYWDFNQIEVAGSKEMAEALAKASGYELGIPSEDAAYGGYKDWFIKKFNKPGYTIECGFGENPLPMTQFDQIYKENAKLMLIAAWG